MRRLLDLMESEINPSDTAAIFKGAADLRDNPGIMGKMFKSLRKNPVNVADLQTSWTRAGRPDDIRDIKIILKKHGFADKEINKVFSSVLGKDDSQQTKGSPAIFKIAEYAKKSGIDQDLIDFMQEEYKDLIATIKESDDFSGKVVMEDIKKIFDNIIREDRYDLPELIRAEENTNLGRNKKETLTELVSLNDVLKADQYVKLLHRLKTDAKTDINVTRIKNRIIQSWKRGMKSRKHYDRLLDQIHINIHDIIGK